MSNIKKFNSFNENHDGDIQNYMFFGNLKTIKRLVDKMRMSEASLHVYSVLVSEFTFSVSGSSCNSPFF